MVTYWVRFVISGIAICILTMRKDYLAIGRAVAIVPGMQCKLLDIRYDMDKMRS